MVVDRHKSTEDRGYFLLSGNLTFLEYLSKNNLKESDISHNNTNYLCKDISSEPISAKEEWIWLGDPDIELDPKVIKASRVTFRNPSGGSMYYDINVYSSDGINIYGWEDKFIYDGYKRCWYFFHYFPLTDTFENGFNPLTSKYEIYSMTSYLNNNKTTPMGDLCSQHFNNQTVKIFINEASVPWNNSVYKWKDGDEDEEEDDLEKNTVVVNTPTLERGSLSTYFSNTKQYSSYGDKFKCYLTIKNSEKVVAVMGLPVYPQEFSETNNGQFQSTSILGRSVDYQTYNSSSRTASVSLTLHEELCHDRLSTLKSQTDASYDYIHLLVSTIESACYPGYDSNGFVSPPSVILQIGDHFRIEGIMTSVSTSWKAPIIDGKLTNCDVSMSITEISGPYDGSRVSSSRGYRT